MLKFSLALTALVAGEIVYPVSATIPVPALSEGAVHVTATEVVPGLHNNYDLSSRGTITIINGEIVVITSGHSIDVSEHNSHISRVTIDVNGKKFSATSWESRLGRNQDVGYIYFSEDVQNQLRPMALPIAKSDLTPASKAQLFFSNRGRSETAACSNVTVRPNMVLQAKNDGLHPTTRVHLTADCNRRMAENSLSGSSLLNENGEIVAVFFAEIEGQRGMNAAFSNI